MPRSRSELADALEAHAPTGREPAGEGAYEWQHLMQEAAAALREPSALDQLQEHASQGMECCYSPWVREPWNISVYANDRHEDASFHGATIDAAARAALATLKEPTP